MSRNKIKIICNAQAGTLSYQFQNEQMVWMPVSQFSDLAKYTTTSVYQSAAEILKVIRDVYNPGNRGVDISFEGSDKDFAYLCKMADMQFSKENISCEHRQARVAVVGKCGVGKTTLIEALGQKQDIRYTVSAEANYKRYKSTSNTIEWYELDGIDLGLNNIARAEAVIDELAEQGLTVLVYCFRAIRVEDMEAQLIQNIRERHPEVSVLGILTNALSENDIVSVEKIGRTLNIKVLPVMAKDQKTRNGLVKAFGHKNVLRAVFEGG